MRSRIKIGIGLAFLCASSVAQTPLEPGVRVGPFLDKIPEQQRLLLMIVVAVVMSGIAFLFRSQLGSLIAQLGGRIRGIRLGTLAVTFGDELKEVLDERKHNPGLALASPDLPQGGAKGADAGARDLVLESWGRLKQVVRDVAEARMAQPSALGKLGEAVGLLVGLGMLSTDYAQQIRLLHDLGQKVADSKGKLTLTLHKFSLLGDFRRLSEPLGNATVPPERLG